MDRNYTLDELIDLHRAQDKCLVAYTVDGVHELTTPCSVSTLHPQVLQRYLEKVAAGETMEMQRCFYPYGPFEATLHERLDVDKVVAIAKALIEAMAVCLAVETYICNVITTSTGHILAFPHVHVSRTVQQMIMARAAPHVRLVAATDLQVQNPSEPYPMRVYLQSPDVPQYFVYYRNDSDHGTETGVPSSFWPAGCDRKCPAFSAIGKAQRAQYPREKCVPRLHSAPVVPDAQAPSKGAKAPVRDSIPKQLKEAIVQEQDNLCEWCESEFHPLNNPYTIDHRGPVCMGGTSDRCNLQALCMTCHRAKTNMDLKCNAVRKQRLKAQRACISQSADVM